MRNLLTTILILTLFLGLSTQAAQEDKPAPELQATLLGGEKFQLSKELGNVIVVHFWASWCESCQTEMPLLEAYYKKHRGEGFKLIAISIDSAKDETKAREIMKRFSFDAALAKDSNYKSYGRIWRLPLNFIIDRAGVLRKDGWILKNGLAAEDLEKTVTPLLKQR